MTTLIRSAAIGALAVATACGGEEGDSALGRNGGVELTVTSPATAAATRSVPGNVVAERQAELATRLSGVIRSLDVDIGSAVSAGDILVTLDTSDVDARIAAAEAAARLARRSWERISALARDGAATAQELDEAKARLEIADANLRDARAQRDYVVLRAPFSGVITARRADPGDLAGPGSPILTLLGDAALKVVADVPGNLAGSVILGEPVQIVDPTASVRYLARITRLVPALDPASKRFRIEARFIEPDSVAVPPGSFVRLELERAADATRWIPASAVHRRGQLTGVFVVESDTLRLRWVRLGAERGDAVELLAGPGPEAQIVFEPSKDLRDGVPVARVRRADWRPPTPESTTTNQEAAR